MSTALTDRTDSLRVHPNLTTTAEMLGVSASTLSRRPDLQVEHRGERDRVLPPAEVMRLAAIYRKRSLNEVAADLISHARNLDVDQADDVEAEIEEFFEERSSEAPRERADFLRTAQRFLTPPLYAEVKRALEDGDGRRPEDLGGAQPPSGG